MSAISEADYLRAMADVEASANSTRSARAGASSVLRSKGV